MGHFGAAMAVRWNQVAERPAPGALCHAGRCVGARTRPGRRAAFPMPAPCQHLQCSRPQCPMQRGPLLL